ncbi:PREDICTED: uncharacterized protein LOC109114191 [Nelumbo nucifera]|uniref:Uncharacterized protein LOC109114191 n=1 Tax=Nelumbo nucifera TaxID=4432 RepID=A0A1U8PZN9_NELNU|nr:PREDICTED: uncharacterized protein LOC109114191 [Nelumbo nucifera]
MGRGKNKRQTVKGAETEDDDGDDTVSTISTAESSDGQQSLSHEAVAQVRGEKPDIEDVLDMLYEKRSSTREQGLDILSKALTSKLQLDFVMSKGETILRQCLSIFRKGSASEISLAARTLGLLGISAGESKLANMIFKESFIHLSRISKQSLDEASRISYHTAAKL